MIENLNNYYIFYIVAKAGNISKAANLLFVSQPAISKSISKLEDELGIILFNRSSRGVTLTEEGKILFEYIEKAFDNIGKGEDNIRRYNTLGIGHIKIGVSTSLCKYILLDYLKDFIKENPHIKVSIDCHSTVNTLHLLKNEEVDIGLICDTEIPKNMIYTPVKEIHDIFVANNDYINNFQLRETEEPAKEAEYDMPQNIFGNMAGLFNQTVSNKNSFENTSMTPKDTRLILERSNLMMLEEANVTRTHIDNYLHSQNIHCEQILEVNNMDLLIDFAAIGMGVASVVKEFSLDYLKSGQITELPLNPQIPKRTVGFVYSDSNNKSTALNKFLEYCGL